MVQGGKGHWTVYFIDPHSFVNTKLIHLRLLINLVGSNSQCLNISTNNLNYTRVNFVFIYRDLNFIVLSPKIPKQTMDFHRIKA